MTDSGPTWQDFEIPKGNFASRIKGAGSSVLRTVRSIERNKRRSMSMVSGLILGFSILAGILLYSAVMMNNVYDTVIEGSPYEIRFDFKGNVSNSQLESYRSQFISDERVADAQIIYGNGRTVTVQTATSISTYTLAYLEADTRIGEAEVGSEARIIHNVNEFLSGEIGARFKELVTGDKNLTTERGIWVDRTFAEAARVQVGMKIDTLNLSIEKFNEEDFMSGNIVISRTSLSNITVAGIVDLDIGASAGLFSEAIFGTSEIFLPSTFLTGDGLQFLEKLADQEMRYCVLKIEESQFNLADLGAVNSQINSLINSFELEDQILIGSNLVQEKLLPFQIMNVFILMFDFILTIPVVILSVYLLSFGIDLALEERRYQVGVLKTQGASGRQIKRKIIGETMLLAVFGIIIGYVFALIGAWGIGTARGYMDFDWDYAISQIGDFLILDMNTIYLVGGFIIIALLIMANGKSNKFIEMEISETVRRAEDEGKKENWLKRNNLDIGFFAVGLVTLGIVFLQQAGISVNVGPIGPIIAILGPFLFWIGGAACVARLAIWLPTKTDRFVKKVGFLKDVNVLVKANIFRKSGEIPRLALIIALTVSFAVLAAVQGTTGEVHQERMITWSVGSDFQVTSGFDIASNMITAIKASDSGIQEVMAVTSTQGIMLNDYIAVYSIDAETYGDVALWQSDNFPQKNRVEQLSQLAANKTFGCLIGEQLLDQQALEVGREVEMEFMTYKLANTTVNGNITDTIGLEYGKVSHSVKILGTFDHLPGGIDSSSLVVDHHLINSLYNLTPYLSILDDLELGLAGSLINFSDIDVVDEFLIASAYLVKTGPGTDAETIKGKLLDSQTFPTIHSVKSLEEEIWKANALQNADYGIPGLLTMDFIVSLLASTLATFIFMSILMEKRKKEFAIMRSYGASKGQVYKVVFSETIVFLVTSITWGLLIGIGLSLLFNGFFEFIEIFVTPLSVLTSGAGLNRLLVFDWISLLVTLGLSFVSMLLATYFSVRGAIKANISTVVRQL